MARNLYTPAPPPTPRRLPGHVTGRGPGYVIVRVATPDGGHIALSGPDLPWVLRGLATAVSPLYGQACVVEEQEALKEESSNGCLPSANERY